MVTEATADAQLTAGMDCLCPYMFSRWVEGFTSLIWSVSLFQLGSYRDGEILMIFNVYTI